MSSITTNRILPVREAYALWAENYDQNPNPLLLLEERTIAPLLPNLDKKIVLDLACGTGRWLAHLLCGGANAGFGIDSSPEMLREARRKDCIQGNLIQADCSALPIRAGVVDFAICSFAASYIDNIHALARELSRVATRPASLFLTDFHPSAHLRGWKRAFRHRDVVVEALSFHYSIDDICDVFKVAGFELITRIEACLGEGERPIFEGCGKGQLLDELSREPAIFVCQFEI